MPLNPRDILAKEFSKSFFGYKPKEVTDFLSLISQSVDELRRDIDRHKTELDLKSQRIKQLEDQSSAIKETLDIARNKSEAMLAEAQTRYDMILQEAEREANAIMDSYQAEINEKKHQLLNIDYVIESYIEKFGQLAVFTLNQIKSFQECPEADRAKKNLPDEPAGQKHKTDDADSYISDRYKRIRER